MSEIGDLIQAYQDKHGTSDRALALRIGVTATLVGRWKKGRYAEVPGAERVQSLADQLGVDQQVVLDAFLRDLNYLPRESDGSARSAAPMKTAARHGGLTRSERETAAETARSMASDEIAPIDPSTTDSPGDVDTA